MGQEWLNRITEILAKAGIAAGEEYASAPAQAITQSVGAVGLRDLDLQAGTATVSVRILSPRSRGGWACQQTAAKAVEALEQEQIRARMERMEYRSGCDCFEILVTGVMRIRPEVLPVPQEPGWHIRIGGAVLEGVEEFSVEQDQDRRMLGAMGQAQPVGVTPGRTGWQLRMVRRLPADAAAPVLPEEPFGLTVRQGLHEWHYTDCCWSRTVHSLKGSVLTVEQQGFALGRKEAVIG